ncbi:MAG: nitroreductase family protein [Lachnospiraceae bacterium]|nr:nitroreductase family protein [Lachnospiraceae bacterium]
MNRVMEALRKRRSVREYDGTAIQKELLDLVLEAGLTAPSGRNLKPVHFLVVEDKETLKYLSQCRKAGSQLIENAGTAILVAGDENTSDTWVEDASIAMAYMHLAADALGLGSCWVQIRNRENAEGENAGKILQEHFAIPTHVHPVAILALGNITAHPEGRQVTDKDSERVHREKYHG